jgi:hypothetical protein
MCDEGPSYQSTRHSLGNEHTLEELFGNHSAGPDAAHTPVKKKKKKKKKEIGFLSKLPVPFVMITSCCTSWLARVKGPRKKALEIHKGDGKCGDIPDE